ncbi:hypothetical protein GFY24_00765 [Nocardia sp. SYP-A9097]|uniref:hypothetical protein n=1 Tax=Nocardia sp. SYP-A9097 TaxID=2663237 RepID=UPI00129BB322|nr:hypothetical protein [Nocardia sp. SYP-A9097]MRH86009.1 hypothetical protein [Nocardia sp. SYP-A9097]
MSVFSRGQAPKYIRWIDADGVSQPVAKVYLGDILIFDGTIPAVVAVPHMTATATMTAPTHQAGQRVSVPPMLASADSFDPPSVVGAVNVVVPPMTAAVGMGPVTPDVPAEVIVPRMSATADLRAATPAALAPGVAPAPAMAAGADMVVPLVTSGAVVAVPPMTASADMPLPVMAGAANLVVPPLIATSTAPVPVVRGAANIIAPPAQATAGLLVPTITAAANVIVPPMQAAASMPVPVVVGGRSYSDDFNRADSSTLGSNWRVDMNSQPKIVTNRALMKTMGNGDGRAGNWASYQGGTNTGKLATDNYGVKAQLISPGSIASDNLTCIVLAVADTFGSGTSCLFGVTTGSGCAIITQAGSPPGSGVGSGGSGQTIQVSTSTNIAVTDLIELRRVGNVFTAYRNGTSLLTWTDSSNIVSSGSTNRRFGLVVEGNFPIFNGEYRSPAIDSIQAYDL